MPITTNASYITTMAEFSAHWLQCNAPLAPDALIVRLKNNIERTLAQFNTLRTTVQGGVAKELEGDERSARLGSFGVRGRLKFGDAPARPALIAGLLWAGVDPSEAEKQSLLRLTAGVELDIGVPKWEVRGHSMRLLPHVLEERYRRPPSALALGDEPSGDTPHNQGAETQIGVAAGRDEPFKILFLKFNAVGIAYRFSDRSDGFRLYLNSVF